MLNAENSAHGSTSPANVLVRHGRGPARSWAAGDPGIMSAPEEQREHQVAGPASAGPGEGRHDGQQRAEDHQDGEDARVDDRVPV